MTETLTVERIAAAMKDANPEFEAWAHALPDTHWAKNSIAAARMGWEARSALAAREGVAVAWQMRPPLEDGRPSWPGNRWRECTEALAADMRKRGWSVRPLYSHPSPADRDAVEALEAAIKIANEAAEEWDKAPEGMRAGKILLALAGHRPGYRADIDAIHAALRTIKEKNDE